MALLEARRVDRLVIRRSTTNRWVAGVCGGLAEAAHLHPAYVRVMVALATVLVGPPMVLAYLLLATVVPRSQPNAHSLAVDWQSDGVRLAWNGPLAPHAVDWRTWWGVFGGVAVGTLLLSVVGGWMGPSMSASLFLSMLWVAAQVGLSTRRFALTLTHEALWVERPLRSPVRLSLPEVEAVIPARDQVSVLLHDGRTFSLPPSPEHTVWDSVRDEVARGRRRIEGFEHALEASAEARRDVEKLLQ